MIEDVIIVGGGPAGLYAAFYCGLRGLKVKLLEAGPSLGGKMNFYKERTVWDVGGLPPLEASQLIKNFEKQAQTFQPTILLRQTIIRFEKAGTAWQVVTATGEVHTAAALILATGAGVVAQMPSLLGESSVLKRVDYQLGALEDYDQQTVVLYGETRKLQRAVKKLSKTTARLMIFSNEPQLFAVCEQLQVLPAPQQLIVEEQRQQLVLKSGNNQEDQAVLCRADRLVVFQTIVREHPLKASLAQQLGCSEYGQVTTTGSGRTASEGVFVVGDASEYEGKAYMIAGAIHDALQAANQAARFLNSEAEPYGRVSTHHPALME